MWGKMITRQSWAVETCNFTVTLPNCRDVVSGSTKYPL